MEMGGMYQHQLMKIIYRVEARGCGCGKKGGKAYIRVSDPGLYCLPEVVVLFSFFFSVKCSQPVVESWSCQ